MHRKPASSGGGFMVHTQAFLRQLTLLLKQFRRVENQIVGALTRGRLTKRQQILGIIIALHLLALVMMAIFRCDHFPLGCVVVTMIAISVVIAKSHLDDVAAPKKPLPMPPPDYPQSARATPRRVKRLESRLP